MSLLGGFLEDAKKNGELDKGGRPKKTPTPEEGVFKKPTFANLGLTYKESSISQALATIAVESPCRH